ncbi:MAG: phosphoribosylaminoimidazolesuccinocarboxamide synthase [Candidatus Thermoplasmatota archaeon]|nr:phosphoribosylaminoimidazolesuccinocarboxamide synthase [Candidatus Thermoplasmatota archaeon]MEC7390993.1 phosphoribosylaminoimidazolesuccinocarboxamide synthase [Candidatus Thermoplasmatota archaeon]MEC7436006.1 phosphoribosylaminoimidazolesuccinocarboxamide synthase [Candidatus Thermoplasmatota archaeon]MEC7544780.1 phosphoribosylaminoimidazolesuccinocarboxamide synthase [Candidatus Thermoplasmatota archaeon]MEC7601856.1 phosphoribosylaminoimidazolesuccinocarboxamide synthase [Candidatus 
MGELLYSGKVKQVWSTEDPDIIEFRYTDQISVFDQIIPSLIPRKGESLNRSSCHWLKMVEDAGICKTHMIEMTAPDRVRARRFEVIREPGAIPQDMENVFVPLEVICRHHLAGSGWRRYKKGDASAEEFGFPAGTELEEGVKLPVPYLEVSTKFEAFDRLLDREEALEISNLREEEFDEILRLVLLIDELIETEVSKRGLIHVDGKKEFALGPGRVPVLVDSFGTLDEDRWWDLPAYQNGEVVQLSKEFVRAHYIESGHHKELYDARSSGADEPPIPALPQSVIDQTADLYATMFERLTGESF